MDVCTHEKKLRRIGQTISKLEEKTSRQRKRIDGEVVVPLCRELCELRPEIVRIKFELSSSSEYNDDGTHVLSRRVWIVFQDKEEEETEVEEEILNLLDEAFLDSMNQDVADTTLLYFPGREFLEEEPF